MDIKKELLEIVGEYVDTPTEEIDINDGLKFATGLDSFVMFSLIGNIEDHFMVTIPSEKLLEFKTLADIIAFLEKELAA